MSESYPQMETNSNPEVGTEHYRPGRSYWAWGLFLLGLCAIGAQALGLRSLVQFGSEKENWQARVAQYEDTLREWERLASERRAALAAAEKERNALQPQIELLKQQYAKASAEAESKKAELQNYTNLRDTAIVDEQTARGKEKAAQEKVQELVETRAQYEQEIAALRDTGRKMQDSIELLKTEESTKKADAATADAAYQRAQQQLQAATAEIEKVRTDLRQTEADANKLRAEVLEKGGDLRKLLAEIQVARDDLSAVRDETKRRNDIKQELLSIQAEVNTLKEKKAEVDRIQMQVAQLNTTLQTTTKQLNEKQGRLGRAAEMLSEKAEEHKTLTSDVITLSRDKTTLESDVQELETEKTDLVKSNSTLKADIDAKNSEIKRLQADISRLRTDEADLLKRVKDLLMRLGDSSVSESTPPASALPDNSTPGDEPSAIDKETVDVEN